MRLFLTSVLFLITSLLVAQNNPASVGEKGAGVIDAPADDNEKGTTRALVVGVSDYQEDAIPDLQFAHKDAEAFAVFLASPSGGNIPPDNITLLTNEKATGGNVVTSLYGLIEDSKDGDRVVIYFSGHGDVETKIFLKPGYLLCYNAPPKVYMSSGGTVKVRDLQDIVMSLTIDRDVKVLLITDACRSGKLAGELIGGTQLTANQLKIQFANEMKILSCQPNEFSLEGEQWGGGRGVFSYHLVNGLYGLADKDQNMEVKLKEIRRYLEDTVPEDVAPAQQNPVVNGDVESFLSYVDPAFIDQSASTGSEVIFSGTSPRTYFENEDTTIQQLYNAFENSLVAGNLLYPEGTSTNDYYNLLLREDSIRDLHGLLTRNFAAALQDEAQLAINDYIRSERFAVEFMRQPDLIQFYQYPEYMERSAELLGEDHILYNQTRAKEFFFRARNLMIEDYLGRTAVSPAVQQRLFCEYVNEGLDYAPQAPYLLAMLGHGKCDGRQIANYQQAVNLSPTWLQAYIWIAEELEKTGDYQAADSTVSQIFSFDSTYVLGYRKKSQLQMLTGNYEAAIQTGETAIALDTSVLDPWYNDWLPAAYVLTHRYEKFRDYRQQQAAELQSRATIEQSLRGTQYTMDLANYHFEAMAFNQAKTLYEQLLQSTSEPVVVERANWGLAWINLIKGQLNEATTRFDSMTSTERLAGLGLTKWKAKQTSEADSLFRTAIDAISNDTRLALPSTVSIILEGNTALAIAPSLADGIARIYELAQVRFPDNADLYYHLGRLYFDQIKKKRKAMDYFAEAIRTDNGYTLAYLYTAATYARSGKTKKAFDWLEQAIQNGLDNAEQIEREPAFDKMRKKERYRELMEQYFPNK